MTKCRMLHVLEEMRFSRGSIGVGTGGGGELGPLTFFVWGAQYDRGPLTFEKCSPIFELSNALFSELISFKVHYKPHSGQ